MRHALAHLLLVGAAAVAFLAYVAGEIRRSGAPRLSLRPGRGPSRTP